MAVEPVRTLAVWVPDWPLVAAGTSLRAPAAVLHGSRVLACTPAARAEGVQVGQRRREAQARCPSLEVLAHDHARDGRAFERVVAAVEVLTPRVEVAEPGTCAFPTRGPSRYWGGDQALAERARGLVHDALAEGGFGEGASCRVAVADGPFAAALATRASVDHPARPVRVVEPGATPAFLAPLPVEVLAGGAGGSGPDVPELVDVLRRLGLRTLGAVAALPAADVVGRFGAEGRQVHRLACGLDDRPPATRGLPPDLVVEAEIDPPAERVDVAAFQGKALADELHQRLDRRGLACTRVVVTLETEHGERLERVWRHEGALGAGAVADRVRWQLDGWLGGDARLATNGAERPTAGISLLRLAPEEVVPAGDRQDAFWGGGRGEAERAARAFARVQALLGPGSVRVVEAQGGRNPADALALVPAEAVDLLDRGPVLDAVLGLGAEGAAGDGGVPVRSTGVAGAAPWPGRLPPPSPAMVHPQPVAAEVQDAEGRSVAVSGRGQVSAGPSRLSVQGGPWLALVAWAGPWTVDERWWDRRSHRRQARFQVLDDEGVARLVALETGRWWVLATYD
jgi:protein ImuB